MPTALAISPHLDDAVFSAGGTLARLVDEGWRVVVATVFTASVPEPTGFALACQLDKGLSADVDYMALRRDEDAAALAILGAEPCWLPFAEAPHRGYQSANALFAGLRDEDDVVGPVTAAIGSLLQRHGPDLVLAPQAIGAHVDHLAVYLAVKSFSVATLLWVDFPYSLRQGTRAEPFAREIGLLSKQVNDVTEAEMGRKLAAVGAYASQLGFQFGGPDAMRSAISSAGSTERFARRMPTHQT